MFVLDEELSGTEGDNTVEYRQDEFESVEVKAAEGEASGRSYEREDDSLEPYADEPLADEEWLENYRKGQEEKQNLEDLCFSSMVVLDRKLHG